MERGAVEAFLQASTAAIAKVNAGVETAERALHAAVRQLERDGVRIVQYVDAGGNATVANRADVAVRRHVRTQIAQDGARMTADAMDRYGVQLVEVSSHPNARPTHASWQGQVYGWRGTVTVDGRTYDGLEAATGYGSVDGLLGANCRHSFGPYLPGAKRAYERDPKHASGLPGEQVYALEQRQRAGERAIREAKRELSGARICHDAAPSPAARAEVVKAQELLARRQDAMRRLVAESNALSVTGRPVLHRHPAREWAGDMAGGARIASSGRKVDELLAGKAAQAAMARAGVSKTAVKRAIADEMKRQGMEPSDFPTLTAGEQRRVFSGIIATLKKTAKPKPIGRHAALFKRIEGDHTAADDLAKTNPNFKPLDLKWAFNCQRIRSTPQGLRCDRQAAGRQGRPPPLHDGPERLAARVRERRPRAVLQQQRRKHPRQGREVDGTVGGWRPRHRARTMEGRQLRPCFHRREGERSDALRGPAEQRRRLLPLLRRGEKEPDLLHAHRRPQIHGPDKAMLQGETMNVAEALKKTQDELAMPIELGASVQHGASTAHSLSFSGKAADFPLPIIDETAGAARIVPALTSEWCAIMELFPD